MTRIGIIGLDSTHAIEFTRAFNTGIPGVRSHARVVAACAGSPTDFPLSVGRRERITREITQDFKVPFVELAQEMAGMVDAFMILSCDGRCHHREALEVIPTGKPIFIDKPLSADWREAAAILHAARLTGSPCFSASALRYRKGPASAGVPTQNLPAQVEISVPRKQAPGHPDLSWYGIHGIESVFSLLGPGCRSVQRHLRAGEDITTGTWHDGSTARIHRTDEESARNFPAYIRSAAGEQFVEGHDYAGLLQVMVDFFRSGIPPLSDRDMIESLAFAAAADVSRDRHGATLVLPDFIAQGSIEGERSSRSG